MSAPVARLEGVCKVYGSGEMAVKALDQLNLTVNRGDYLAVMGASGSGKSTAMNILGCLDRPSSGSYRLN
ncbi:MAG: ATP-binding cassette domain-containing protein, partial [Cyanobium sp.]